MGNEIETRVRGLLHKVLTLMFLNVTGVDVKAHNTGNWAKGYGTGLKKNSGRKK